ncbi:MAG: YkgJ family cysteine cluster protein [Sulfolobales archaeon]|nr:YkgJ family cysteine cluster protein [Sulfolobales archaeon]MCX8185584.1 YkgJ family cysteine cluster protein [Sulfolobales archaeon]MDW7969527.1 YkgJ family cysteine cluster protein [Sulfolobales archaeon]
MRSSLNLHASNNNLLTTNLRFECYRCSHCCYFTVIEESPIVIEDEVINLKSEAVRLGLELKFVDLGNGLFRWVIEGYCPFYSTTSNLCSIHEKKPLSCRIYPLLLNMRTGDIHLSTACDWVIQNLNTLSKGNLDVEEVFKNEVSWIKILYKKLLST